MRLISPASGCSPVWDTNNGARPPISKWSHRSGRTGFPRSSGRERPPLFAGNILGQSLINTAVGLSFAKLFEGCFVARPEYYKILTHYETLPPQQARGEALLKGAAKESPPCAGQLAEAEALFEEAACTTTVHAYKAHAYRHAAIAAKLRGQTAKAEQYMLKSVTHRKKSDGDSDFNQGPVRDIAACNRETDFPINRLVHIPRTLFLVPFIALVAFLERCFRKNRTPAADRLRQLLMPFQTAKERMQTRLTAQFNTLEGEADDQAWIFNKLPPGMAAGKGFWRKFFRT